MKRKTKKRLTIIAGAVLLGAAGYTLYRLSASPAAEQEPSLYKEEQAVCGDLMQGVTESGTVELLTTDQVYDLDLTTEDDEDETSDEDTDDEEEKYLRIEAVYAAKGERIREGDAVLKLTDKSVAAVRRKLEARAAQAQLALVQAQNALEQGTLEARHTMESAALTEQLAGESLRVADADQNGEILQAYARIPVLETEIQQIRQELEDSWEDYDELRDDCEEAQKELERCDESRLTRYIGLRDAYREISERLRQEEDRRAAQEEAITDKQEEMAELYLQAQRLRQKLEREKLTNSHDYDAQVQEGELAQEIYDASVEALEADVRSAESERKEAQETLDEFTAFAGDGVVYALGSGLVTDVGCEAGDVLSGETTLLSFVPEDHYQISVDVSEEDIPCAQVGGEVSIVFVSCPDTTYAGVIQEIGASASDDHAATISYPVTIAIQGDTTPLYGGMTGDVTFVTEKVEQVVSVSRSAVIEQNGKSYVCQKDAQGQMILTPVETGFTDGISVEIVSGLQAGDTVYVATKGNAGSDTEE